VSAKATIKGKGNGRQSFHNRFCSGGRGFIQRTIARAFAAPANKSAAARPPAEFNKARRLGSLSAVILAHLFAFNEISPAREQHDRVP
jgi:hypothetical protein